MNDLVDTSTGTAKRRQRISSLPPVEKLRYDEIMEARVAVLEQIAKDTRDVLVEMKHDIRDIRLDQKTDFRLMFSALIAASLGLAGLMAHGFRWF